eukprot:scaffold580530_cov19-Prasinocladus_malaysianus.AAC.1
MAKLRTMMKTVRAPIVRFLVTSNRLSACLAIHTSCCPSGRPNLTKPGLNVRGQGTCTYPSCRNASWSCSVGPTDPNYHCRADA